MLHNFIDEGLNCIGNHPWLSQVFKFWQDGLIDTDTLVTAMTWVSDNLC